MLRNILALLFIFKCKDCKIHVFRLLSFESEPGADEKPRSKLDLKEHRLDRTKATHLYALSRPGASHLRMAVAVGRKIQLFQWKHSTAWTAWCAVSDTDTVEGFALLREISLLESPTIMTLIDSTSTNTNNGGLKDNQICVGYRSRWDLVNERSGEVSHLHDADAPKANLVAAIEVYEDDDAELLLCSNNKCHFQKLSSSESGTQYDFSWTSVPVEIVCAFPYILAFSRDGVEIRLVVNGNLVQTMAMPELAFITQKADIFFATTAPEFMSAEVEALRPDKTDRDASLSPPTSPRFSSDGPYKGSRRSGSEVDWVGVGRRSESATKPYRVYRIPFCSLSSVGIRADAVSPLPGQAGAEKELLKDAPNTPESSIPSASDHVLATLPQEAEGSSSGNQIGALAASTSPRSQKTHRPAVERSPSPVQCPPPNANNRVVSPHRNRTNSLTVQMGSFPYMPVKHDFSNL